MRLYNVNIYIYIVYFFLTTVDDTCYIRIILFLKIYLMYLSFCHFQVFPLVSRKLVGFLGLALNLQISFKHHRQPVPLEVCVF